MLNGWDPMRFLGLAPGDRDIAAAVLERADEMARFRKRNELQALHRMLTTGG